jgi:hypothetical protein
LVVAVTFAVQALLIGTILSTGPLLVADSMGFGAWHVGLTFAGEPHLERIKTYVHAACWQVFDCVFRSTERLLQKWHCSACSTRMRISWCHGRRCQQHTLHMPHQSDSMTSYCRVTANPAAACSYAYTDMRSSMLDPNVLE